MEINEVSLTGTGVKIPKPKSKPIKYESTVVTGENMLESCMRVKDLPEEYKDVFRDADPETIVTLESFPELKEKMRKR